MVVDWGGSSASAPDERAAVHIAFDSPTGELGGRTAEEIERVIKTRVARYRACYLGELPRAPTIRAKLVVHLVIGGDGRVRSVDSPASSESTTRNRAVTECVISHMKRLVFPVTGQTAHVTSSFEITPVE
ncbi:MAG TPA: AgmX/PglI C-terminal domain-containing protein [Kofleriaceae bacterium]|nr:AgmX/PglI C-terminal domain-containing protein [Kofleriaceae bacterium]